MHEKKVQRMRELGSVVCSLAAVCNILYEN